MKKSQLKKIIKESIKELMNEQANIDGACMAVVMVPAPGPPPVVSQTFINNMQNKNCNFYDNKFANFNNKMTNLLSGNQPCLVGDNPVWQTQLQHKKNYIRNNFGPGTTMNCTLSPPK